MAGDVHRKNARKGFDPLSAWLWVIEIVREVESGGPSLGLSEAV